MLFLQTDKAFLERVFPLLLRRVQGRPADDPLWMFPPILNDYMNLQHAAIYAIRDLTTMEELRIEHSQVPKSTAVYGRLHDVTRWAIVVCEILAVNVKTLEHVVECHESFLQRLLFLLPEQRTGNSTTSSSADILTINTARGTHQDLRFYQHMIHSMNCRCDSYRDRMKNEIQLVFNVVAQSSEAQSSMAIALAGKVDSETMKATSLIALVFLPPTFVSAVFSTTFFEFGADAQSWGVSDKFWLYWAWVVPLTLACLVVWYVWFFRGTVALPIGRQAESVRQRNMELRYLRDVAISH